ncbi:hypothetical protein BASH2_04670 [Bacillus anthracis]|nr:hypothetical protein BASH2_04670 [Bacillus anthracis]
MEERPEPWIEAVRAFFVLGWGKNRDMKRGREK